MNRFQEPKTEHMRGRISLNNVYCIEHPLESSTRPLNSIYNKKKQRDIYIYIRIYTAPPNPVSVAYCGELRLLHSLISMSLLTRDYMPILPWLPQLPIMDLSIRS